MSLRDTIEEAKREAAAGRSEGSSADETTVEDDLNGNPRSGFSKKSVTRAKPVRDAGASVRVVSASEIRSGKKNAAGKTQSEMSKEEKKEARRARRDAEDRRMTAARVLLKNNAEYKKGQRVWWIMLGVGIALTIFCGVIQYFAPNAARDPFSGWGLVSLICIVPAYGCIIGAFIHDWRKVRPIRQKCDAAVASMTDKKVMQVLAGEVTEAEVERIAAKMAKKRK